MTLAIVVGLCLLTFAAGWAMGRLLRSGHDHGAPLMFGLGMSKNGTGLVMAALWPRRTTPVCCCRSASTIWSSTSWPGRRIA